MKIAVCMGEWTHCVVISRLFFKWHETLAVDSLGNKMFDPEGNANEKAS